MTIQWRIGEEKPWRQYTPSPSKIDWFEESVWAVAGIVSVTMLALGILVILSPRAPLFAGVNSMTCWSGYVFGALGILGLAGIAFFKCGKKNEY